MEVASIYVRLMTCNANATSYMVPTTRQPWTHLGTSAPVRRSRFIAGETLLLHYEETVTGGYFTSMSNASLDFLSQHLFVS